MVSEGLYLMLKHWIHKTQDFTIKNVKSADLVQNKTFSEEPNGKEGMCAILFLLFEVHSAGLGSFRGLLSEC